MSGPPPPPPSTRPIPSSPPNPPNNYKYRGTALHYAAWTRLHISNYDIIKQEKFHPSLKGLAKKYYCLLFSEKLNPIQKRIFF